MIDIRRKLHGTILHSVYGCIVSRAWRAPWWRLKDRLRTLRDPELRRLHLRLTEHLRAEKCEWSHPYGYGYFYQGWERIGITGIRHVEERFDAYRLRQYLRPNMRLLDIASNTGFMSLRCASEVAEVDAVEINPHLVRIAEEVAHWLGVTNVTFSCKDFLEFNPDKTYDGIMSLACHYTDDGNMRPRFREYLERVNRLLTDEGHLFFESHSTEAHSEDFRRDLASHSDLFALCEVRFLGFGKAKGGDRVFAVLRKATNPVVIRAGEGSPRDRSRETALLK